MGKGNSKLKRKNRAQSMAWNFRFPSMTSLSIRRKGTTIGIHMSIKQWLNILNLSQYEILFEKFKGVEDVMRYTDQDLKDLGVKNDLHRTKMAKSLIALKNKYEQRINKATVLSTPVSSMNSGPVTGISSAEKTVQRHSVAVDPTTLIKQSPTESDILAIKNFNQSKSLCNIKMEAVSPEPDMDAVQLKKMLEWELSLDNRDLRSHAWYHGAIPRIRAEEIVSENDGDFLVRDCTSQPGNYVLSCRSKNQNLHFVINKIVLQPDTVYERIQYRFEEDGYDTVPDLITYYVGSGKPITLVSGAKIQTPRNRLYPLSFYANKYELHHQQQLSSTSGSNRTSSPVSLTASIASSSATMSGTANSLFQHTSSSRSFRSPISSPPRIRRENSCTVPSSRVDAKLSTKKQRSLSLLSTELQTHLSENSHHSNENIDNISSINNNHNNHNNHNSNNHNNHNSNNHNNNDNISNMESSCHRQVFSNSLPRHSFSNGKMQITPNTMPRNTNGKQRLMNGQKSDAESSCDEPFPPPKPSRISSSYLGCNNYKQDLSRSGEMCKKNSFYHTSGSDSGNGSGDSVSIGAEVNDCATPVSTLRRSSAAGGVVIKNPKYFCQQTISGASSLTTLKAAYSYDTVFEDALDADRSVSSCPLLELPSVFDLDSFHTLLLPMAENKPLDSSALQGVRMLLQDSGSRILANHITRTDIELILNDKCYSKLMDDSYSFKSSCYCSCGIELCLLPHGRQLRLDLIERTECIKLLVAVTILTCGSDSERAEVLNKWISVAVDTKTALGNLFGFCSVMMGLCMPQIERLTSTWHILRQKFTDSAFNFEAKLRPTLKSMNEGTNPLAPNTTIPHLLPALLLYEQTFDDIVGSNQQSERKNMITHWENSSSDLGLNMLHTHLENARQYCQLLPTFKRNSEIVLSDSKIDDLLLDMFRTEFHLKFLWGSRGATVSHSERYAKFEQVLDVMSDKCESIESEIYLATAVETEPTSVIHSTAV